MKKNTIFLPFSTLKKVGGRLLVSRTLNLFEAMMRNLELIKNEHAKPPGRLTILNEIIKKRGAKRYLEIGVRDPNANFNWVDCEFKDSVDPGLEFKTNPVKFKMTSDDFYQYWESNGLSKYDVIFIDGLHLAEQVHRDVENCLRMSAKNGVLVLHDCNPPAPEFARENYLEKDASLGYWNGTTWKAFCKYHSEGEFEARVIDSDWGVGIIDKMKPKTPKDFQNPFFEWAVFERLKAESDFLISFNEFQKWF